MQLPVARAAGTAVLLVQAGLSLPPVISSEDTYLAIIPGFLLFHHQYRSGFSI